MSVNILSTTYSELIFFLTKSTITIRSLFYQTWIVFTSSLSSIRFIDLFHYRFNFQIYFRIGTGDTDIMSFVWWYCSKVFENHLWYNSQNVVLELRSIKIIYCRKKDTRVQLPSHLTPKFSNSFIGFPYTYHSPSRR